MVSSKCFADIGQTQPFVAARVFRSPPALRDQLFGKVGLCPPQSDSSRPDQRSLGVAMAGVHSGSRMGSMMPRPTRQPDHQRTGFCRPPRSPGKPAPVFTFGPQATSFKTRMRKYGFESGRRPLPKNRSERRQSRRCSRVRWPRFLHLAPQATSFKTQIRRH